VEPNALKARLHGAIEAALEALSARGELPAGIRVDYQIEVPKHASHGDFSTNAALLLAKPSRRAPRELAALLAAELAGAPLLARVDVAGPGFVNFVLADTEVFEVLAVVQASSGAYGRSGVGAGRRVQVEFVSANPTGPLHIGHGRGAAMPDM
jgi:arginyl-tRNA synthetase